MENRLYFTNKGNEIQINRKMSNSEILEILLNNELDKNVEKTISEFKENSELKFYTIEYGILKDIQNIICNSLFNRNGIIFQINGKNDYDLLNEIYSFIEYDYIYGIVTIDYFTFIENGFNTTFKNGIEYKEYFEINRFPNFLTNKDLEILDKIYDELVLNDYEYNLKLIKKSLKLFCKIVKRIIKQLVKIIDKYTNLKINLDMDIEKKFIMENQNLFNVLENTEKYISYEFKI